MPVRQYPDGALLPNAEQVRRVLMKVCCGNGTEPADKPLVMQMKQQSSSVKYRLVATVQCSVSPFRNSLINTFLCLREATFALLNIEHRLVIIVRDIIEP